MKTKTICLFGGTGKVGMHVLRELKKEDIRIKVSIHDKSKIELLKELLDPYDELVECDLYNIKEAIEFCKNSDLVIGAAGPSREFSENMFFAASYNKIPYLDPSASFIFDRKQILNKINIPCILETGIFPGLSGIIIKYCLDKLNGMDTLEISIGGDYKFSDASGSDFIDETLNGKGNPLACLENGQICAAKKWGGFDKTKGLVSFPYLTSEIIYMAKKYDIPNIESYILVSNELFNIIKSGDITLDKLKKLESNVSKKNKSSIIIIKATKCGKKIEIDLNGMDHSIVTAMVVVVIAKNMLRDRMNNGLYRSYESFDCENVLKALIKKEVFNLKIKEGESNG